MTSPILIGYFPFLQNKMFKEVFTKFKSMVESQLDRKIKKIQTDEEVSSWPSDLFWKKHVLFIGSHVPMFTNRWAW